MGVAMRAAADDAEAAQAVGIAPSGVARAAWALAGALGALAGVLAATTVGGGVRPGLVGVGFAALPAVLLGGLGSEVGAVAGAVAVGLVQQWSAGYAPAWAGGQFSTVVPYV